jgi:hypothetical protein
MFTRNVPGAKGRTGLKAYNLWADYLDNVRTSTSHNPMAPTAFYCDSFSLYIFYSIDIAGSEFLTAVNMNGRFGGTYCFSHQLYHKDGDDMFVRNVGLLSTDYMALYDLSALMFFSLFLT